MIVLVCGPSGGGKTTLLQELAAKGVGKLITVTVSRSNPRVHAEPGKTEVTKAEFDALRGKFDFISHYNDSSYGYSVHSLDISSAAYCFLDYPGEYPACSEFSDIEWKGILVLPSCREDLIKRLMHQGKEHRIASATREYDEAVAELQNGYYRPPEWRVYRSGDFTSLRRLIDQLKAGQVFSTNLAFARVE